MNKNIIIKGNIDNFLNIAEEYILFLKNLLFLKLCLGYFPLVFSGLSFLLIFCFGYNNKNCTIPLFIAAVLVLSFLFVVFIFDRLKIDKNFIKTLTQSVGLLKDNMSEYKISDVVIKKEVVVLLYSATNNLSTVPIVLNHKEQNVSEYSEYSIDDVVVDYNNQIVTTFKK